MNIAQSATYVAHYFALLIALSAKYVDHQYALLTVLHAICAVKKPVLNAHRRKDFLKEKLSARTALHPAVDRDMCISTGLIAGCCISQIISEFLGAADNL